MVLRKKGILGDDVLFWCLCLLITQSVVVKSYANEREAFTAAWSLYRNAECGSCGHCILGLQHILEHNIGKLDTSGIWEVFHRTSSHVAF